MTDSQQHAVLQLAQSVHELGEQRDALRTALEDALCIIEALDGRDNSCDPRQDLSELREVLARAHGGAR
jgi:hypothetical protein